MTTTKAEDEKAGRHEFVGSGGEFCWHRIGTPGSRYACGQSASATCHLPPVTKAGQAGEVVAHCPTGHGSQYVQQYTDAGGGRRFGIICQVEECLWEITGCDSREDLLATWNGQPAASDTAAKRERELALLTAVLDAIRAERDALKAGTDKREASAFARMEELRVEWQRAEADRDRLAARVGELEAGNRGKHRIVCNYPTQPIDSPGCICGPSSVEHLEAQLSETENHALTVALLKAEVERLTARLDAGYDATEVAHSENEIRGLKSSLTAAEAEVARLREELVVAKNCDQRAGAWCVNFDLLRETVPGFIDLDPTGLGCVLASIHQLSALRASNRELVGALEAAEHELRSLAEKMDADMKYEPRYRVGHLYEAADAARAAIAKAQGDGR